MSGIAEALRTMVAGQGASLVFSAVVLAALAAAMLSFLFLRKPGARDRVSSAERRPEDHPASGSGVTLQFHGKLLAGGAGSTGLARLLSAQPGDAGTKRFRGVRSVARAIHGVVSVLIVTVFVVATIASYQVATPSNGGLLVTGVLAILTLFVALQLHTSNRRLAEADPAVRADLLRTFQSNLATKLGDALAGQAQVRWDVGSPEVHTMDRETLALAKQMSAEGRNIDAICRTINADYGRWTAPHQQAFQAVIRTAIEQDG